MQPRTAWSLLILATVVIGALWWWNTAQHSPQQTTSVSVNYVCSANKTITATFIAGTPSAEPSNANEPPTPTGSVALILSDGRSMTLPQTISADGIRYANADNSFIFWSKGNGAFVEENNSQTYTGCVSVLPDPGGLPNAYATSTDGFSLRYPAGYIPDDSYHYQELGPGNSIEGVKFTISTSTSAGTNLAPDTYLSVEEIPNATSTCDAPLFLSPPVSPETLTDNGTTYSVASSTGAAAGNRYEEWVYAIPGSNPCVAVRYFIHYGVIENYPPGSVQQFDEAALLLQFDAMRRTLTLL